jgi:hypothetical protein
MIVSTLFCLCRQTREEASHIFYSNTSLSLKLKDLEQPFAQTLSCISTAARQNIRTIDLHYCVLYFDHGTEDLISSIQEWFPKFQAIHLTIEQRPPCNSGLRVYRPGELFSITHQSLSKLVEMPFRLTRIRIFVEDCFKRRRTTLPSFQAFLDCLSGFAHLEEVEIYFQTIVHGFILYPTPTFTPEPAPTRAAYLALERNVLTPYLSSLASALPRVKRFQIWRLRARGEDQCTGTQPFKEEGLLRLLGGKATDLDSQAGFPVVKRLLDGSAFP